MTSAWLHADFEFSRANKLKFNAIFQHTSNFKATRPVLAIMPFPGLSNSANAMLNVMSDHILSISVSSNIAFCTFPLGF